MSTTVRLEGVWKSYPRWRGGTRSLRSTLSPRLRARGRTGDRRWALRDISLSIESGRSLGVIGHNGAGKSTLLRLTSGLGRPTRGSIRVVESAVSVLSLGDTFNAELTGRENALTAAMIAGIRAGRARELLPDMIAFAELEGFEEAPVRSYSDGMKLRLGFGVVAQLKPELLVLDEVLAVGDGSFQAKCLEWIHELRAQGMSVLFASHGLDQVVEECDHALWLEHGRVRGLGPSEDVVNRYQAAMATATLDVTPPPSLTADDHLILQDNRFGSQEVVIRDVAISSGETRDEVLTGATLELSFTISAPRTQDRVIVSVSIFRPEGDVSVIDLNSEMDDIRIGPVAGDGTRVALALDDLELLPGDYELDVGVYPTDWAHAYDYHWHAYPFKVRGVRHENAVYRPNRRRWFVDGGAGR